MSEQSNARPDIAPWLREIMVCPRCHSALTDQPGPPPTLACDNTTTGDCGLRYPVEDGIPVLLIDEGVAPGSGTNPK